MVSPEPSVDQGTAAIGGDQLPQQVAVIGLGYVGLQLAVAFSRVLPTLGFDIDPTRIRELREGHDRNGEINDEALDRAHLQFTYEEEDLAAADCFVITVPTPLDGTNRPDLSAMIGASRAVGRAIASRVSAERKAQRRGGVEDEAPLVVYESTVYPGCTEDVCMPALEEESEGAAFRVGYSPERINPGDREHSLARVVKVVAGQDAETTERIKDLYSQVVEVGVYVAPNIRTAEACKVIENVQRDQNIASINELAMLFHRLGLDTQEVLKAARTKWNFLPFEPGLVGGHCIPVDPYYLSHKAEEVGYHSEMVLAGRHINDQMGRYVAREGIKLLCRSGKTVMGARVLVLGMTFKENVPDVRNTRVVDLVDELEAYGAEVHVHDPLVSHRRLHEMGFRPVNRPFGVLEENIEATDHTYEMVVLAVPHLSYKERPAEDYLGLLGGRDGERIFLDVKGAFKEELQSRRDLTYWVL